MRPSADVTLGVIPFTSPHLSNQATRITAANAKLFDISRWFLEVMHNGFNFVQDYMVQNNYILV